MLLVVLLAIVSFGTGVYIKFSRIPVPSVAPRPDTPVANRPDDGEAPPVEPKLEIKGRINILLLGEDNVEQVKRSDTVLFVAVDIDNKNVRVLSLPRDTRVAIPRHGNQKLNHAYAFGGVDLLRATVENFLGTTIHYYVKIDYDNFPKLVDAVGGVDIHVAKAMKYRDRAQDLTIDIPAGFQRMNGDTALKYVRFRKDALGDIGRVERQQQFLKAMLHRMYDPQNLVRFNEIATEIQNTVITDMDTSLVLQLCLFMKKLEKERDRVFFVMLPGTPAFIDGLSYWIAERSSVSDFLTADSGRLLAIANESKNTPITTLNAAPQNNEMNSAPSPIDTMDIVRNIPEAVAVLNGSGKKGMGQSVASRLQKIGVDVVHVGNAKHFDYRTSNVIYPEKAPESVKTTAQMLSKLCGISTALTRANSQASYASLIVGHDYEALLKRLDKSYASIE